MGALTEKQKIGRIGEDISVKYLENKGFRVVERNYLKKCGEIDIIAKKSNILHFIEVKSVSCEILEVKKSVVSRETDNYRPEDNIHEAKLRRLAKTIQVYLFEKHPHIEPEWVFDVIIVRLDFGNHRAKIRFLDNIVL